MKWSSFAPWNQWAPTGSTWSLQIRLVLIRFIWSSGTCQVSTLWKFRDKGSVSTKNGCLHFEKQHAFDYLWPVYYFYIPNYSICCHENNCISISSFSPFILILTWNNNNNSNKKYLPIGCYEDICYFNRYQRHLVDICETTCMSSRRHFNVGSILVKAGM